MSDLISRQDAIEAIRNYYPVRGRSGAMACLTQCKSVSVDKEYLTDLIQEAVYDGEACAKLMNLVDRPTGEWVEQESDNIEKIYLCSNCENYEAWGETEKTPYCPNCGAKMGG